MKLSEYKKLNNIVTEEDFRKHFADNMRNNKLPVALYSCPKCDEILGDNLLCPICSYSDVA